MVKKIAYCISGGALKLVGGGKGRTENSYSSINRVQQFGGGSEFTELHGSGNAKQHVQQFGGWGSEFTELHSSGNARHELRTVQIIIEFNVVSGKKSLRRIQNRKKKIVCNI